MLVDSMCLADLDSLEPRSLERLLELATGQRSRDATGPCGHVAACALVHVLVRDHVGYGEASTGSEDPRRLGDHAPLVGRQVDDAIRDDDVDALVDERQLLDVALGELDVAEARLPRVCAR